MSDRLKQIIKQFKDIQDGPLWMGENFEKKIQKLKGVEVFIRPEPSIHSIAELIAHLTAWRKDAILKITTGKGHLLDEMPENWRCRATELSTCSHIAACVQFPSAHPLSGCPVPA